MDVSIIIVNYNTFKMTQECIESVIEKTKDINYEIILVDNASTDESKDVFSSDERITYIYNNENLGFGRANNIGVKMAHGRNILFLNSDTLLINNAIKILSYYLDSHETVGAVGGNLYDFNMKPAMSFQRLRPSIVWELNSLFLNLPLRLRYGKVSTYFNTGSKPINVGYIMGADLMVRKNIIDEIGCFDHDFFMYFEETDLCNRINKNGYELKVIPEAQIIHLEGKSFNSDSSKPRINPKRIEMFENSRNLYYRKNLSSLQNKIISAIYTCNLNINRWLFKILGKHQHEKATEYKLNINKQK